MDDWKKIIQDMYGGQQHQRIEKKGIMKLKFLNEGKLVSGNMTGHNIDSVVFLVEQDGETKELWFTMLNPVLKELAGLGGLAGKEVTFNFTGEGREMRCEIVKE